MPRVLMAFLTQSYSAVFFDALHSEFVSPQRTASQTSSTIISGLCAGSPPLYTPLRTSIEFHLLPPAERYWLAPSMSLSGLSVNKIESQRLPGLENRVWLPPTI